MHPRELFSDIQTGKDEHEAYHDATWETLSNSRLSIVRRNPQKYYQRFVTHEIEDEDKECLRFGRVFHETVLEPASGVDAVNVHADTLGIFRVCGTPTREPDETDEDGASIWFQDLPEPGVVRRSAWWGELDRRRVWILNPEIEGKDRRRNNCRIVDVEHVFNVLGTMESCPTYFCSSPKQQTGFCAYADMVIDGDHFRTIRSDVLSKSGSRAGQEWKDFVKSLPPGMVAYKPAEWFNILAMRRELRSHPESRRILFGEPGKNRHTEFTIKGVDRETGVDFQTRLDFCQNDLDEVLVCDLKSSRDASPGCWRRQAERDGLHVQAAIQIGMAELLFQKPVKFRFIVCQKDAPFRVEVYQLEDEFIELGVEDYLRDVRRFADCRATGIWQPPRYGDVKLLETPKWRQMDHQLAWRNEIGEIDYETFSEYDT